jgi:alpha-L-fucosidase
MPPECDVSIRPGWFWHERENDKVKTPRQLLDLYYRSVGRGGSMLLNVPPDRRGLLHENDVASLRGFGALVRGTFEENLAAKAKLKGAARNLLDGGPYTYWSGDSLEIPLPAETKFNVVRLRENIKLGQRIDGVELDRWTDGRWDTFAKATSIGACRLIRTANDITASRLRLRVTQSSASPALSDFGLFLEKQ